MSDHHYTHNLDAAVRRSAGVNHSHDAKSARFANREALLRVRREREKAQKLQDENKEAFVIDDETFELTDEELREYAEFLEMDNGLDNKAPAAKSQHSLGINGAESLGGSYTNEKHVTGEALHADKKHVNELLHAAHREGTGQEEHDRIAEESEKAKKEGKRRELVAKLFVSALLIAMLATAFWSR